MIFEWDNAKNIQNYKKHGILFEEAKEVFYNDHLKKIDGRYDYGEIRQISIGSIQDIIIAVVVHTDRDGTIRIISARKANKKEREVYYDHIKKTS